MNTVNPEIESCHLTQGPDAARDMLFDSLKDNYDSTTPSLDVESRPWYGRCVWESDNDVCDDQHVNITWEDDLDDETDVHSPSEARYAKTASFHMIAQTQKQCERRGWIYGSKGEISYDGSTISVFDFQTEKFQYHHPPRWGGGHGGGDEGLVAQFLKSVDAVKNQGMGVEEAQAEYLGCTLEEIIRSHALVFAAEEARKEQKVVQWKQWWSDKVETETRA